MARPSTFQGGWPSQRGRVALPLDGDAATTKEKWVAFLLGLGARLNVKLIGYLPFTELALILAFPLLLPRYASAGSLRRSKWTLPLLFVWLAGQVFSDIYRETAFGLAARGVARIIVFIVCVPFFTYFMAKGAYEKILWFTIGLVPSFALSAFVFRSGIHESRERVYGTSEINWETHWGGVYGGIVLIGCIYIYGRSHVACYASAFGMGVVQIIKSARATGAVGIISVVLTVAVNALKAGGIGERIRQKVTLPRLILLFVVMLGGIWGTLSLYSYAAKDGMLGERAQRKYLNQSATQFGLFGGGRPGFVCGVLAITESPMIGYGSWPQDNTELMKRTCDMLGARYEKPVAGEYPVIPAHSQLLGSWVEAGIAGVFFWLYLLALFVRAIWMPLKDDRRLRWYMTYMAVFYIWGILFSPISARIETAMMIGLVFTQAVPRLGGSSVAKGGLGMPTHPVAA
jgi:hypothetical protein